MEKQYFVESVEVCSVCGGDGYVLFLSGLWDEFAEASNAERDRLKELFPGSKYFARRTISLGRFDDKWWSDHGWPGGVYKWPPVEAPCGECSGTGQTRQRVKIDGVALQLQMEAFYAKDILRVPGDGNE